MQHEIACFVYRHQACQKVQSDIDAKIKWATQESEAAQAAQTQLESNISKLQNDLKQEVSSLAGIDC